MAPLVLAPELEPTTPRKKDSVLGMSVRSERTGQSFGSMHSGSVSPRSPTGRRLSGLPGSTTGFPGSSSAFHGSPTGLTLNIGSQVLGRRPSGSQTPRRVSYTYVEGQSGSPVLEPTSPTSPNSPGSSTVQIQKQKFTAKARKSQLVARAMQLGTGTSMSGLDGFAHVTMLQRSAQEAGSPTLPKGMMAPPSPRVPSQHME